MNRQAASKDKIEEYGDLDVRVARLMATKIVVAYISHHHVPKTQLPVIIKDTLFIVLRLQLQAKKVKPVIASHALKPAVPISLSITPDAVICLEDGKPFKSLRRHLMSCFGMTPDDYRQKWGLPSNYPMVAPNYALKRSKLAKDVGLGKALAGSKARLR